MKSYCRVCRKEIERNPQPIGAAWIHSNGHKARHVAALIGLREIQSLYVQHIGGVSAAQLMRKDKRAEVSTARHLIALVAREIGNTAREIARASKRTENNINHSLRAAQNLIETDAEVRKTYSKLYDIIGVSPANKYRMGGMTPLRERMHVVATNISPAGFWIKFQAANARTGTAPELKMQAGDIVIVEETAQI